MFPRGRRAGEEHIVASSPDYSEGTGFDAGTSSTRSVLTKPAILQLVPASETKLMETSLRFDLIVEDNVRVKNWMKLL